MAAGRAGPTVLTPSNPDLKQTVQTVFLVTIFDLGDIDMFRILLSFFSILGGGGYRNPVSEEWGRDP